MAAVCLRSPSSWHPEVGVHFVHLAAAIAAGPGLAGGVIPSGRPETLRSWVAVVAVATIRYRSRSQN